MRGSVRAGSFHVPLERGEESRVAPHRRGAREAIERISRGEDSPRDHVPRLEQPRSFGFDRGALEKAREIPQPDAAPRLDALHFEDARVGAGEALADLLGRTAGRIRARFDQGFDARLLGARALLLQEEPFEVAPGGELSVAALGGALRRWS